ncbi:hypothetical protein DSO57_1021557 [Entomophthora muscae]|uniref:Uncharacterized protein n=1 Tax=Entomophthora muscae TaxID=34485 RepID=A0ACC2U186_9FUNG|nr:hypothetical protein DSO57_1021557 [Entomophthora muscae]
MHSLAVIAALLGTCLLRGEKMEITFSMLSFATCRTIPTVMNDISILPGSQGKPYVDQSGQETAQLLAGLNPGPPEIDDPNQEEQKPVNLQSVNTGGSKSTLETLESNPKPPKTT